MPSIKRLLSTALLICGLFPAVWSATLLTEVRAAIKQAQPFRVNFTQQVYIDDEKEIEESGFILFQNQQKLRWEYSRPEKKVFILEDDRYQFYQPENRQLLRGRVKEQREELLWQILNSDSAHFQYTLDERQRCIMIRSLNGNEPITMEIFVNAANLPERVIRTDTSGVRQVFIFKSYSRHQTFPAGAFLLEIPKGTEIVDE